MKKLRRLPLIAFGVVVALAAILLIGVNLYVQSAGTHAKIQQELSRRLGTTLGIRSMSVTPWGGLELSGITIAQTSPIGPRHFLEAKTFRLRVRFLSLFSRRLVIKEVALVEPNVVWPQDAEGKWKLPRSKGLKTGAPHVSRLNARNRSLQTAPTPQTQHAPVVATSPASPPPAMQSILDTPSSLPEPRLAVPPEVRRVSIKNGNFSFLDHAGRLLASFNGVDFRTSIRSALALHGNTKIARISLQNRFFLEDLRSPLRYEPDVLELSKIAARAGKGQINGYFAMQPDAEGSPFTTNVRFRDVLADEIISNAGGPRGMVHGKLEGNFQASGKTADPEAFVGTGEISLRDGRVQQYSLLVLLGELLQIEELRELNLEQAEAKYHVRPGLVTIDELILRSPNIRLTASGTIAFDGKLKLDSQLAINDKIRGQLFKAIRQNFQPINEPGYSAIDFQVGGTVDRPSTNLMDRLVGRDISSMINSFFGGGKKERTKKKKKQVEQAAPTTPAPQDTDNAMPAPPAASPAAGVPMPAAIGTPIPTASP
ncbi:MAG TPA: AsmA-like C-terminal region-containing protein [Candidatus Udaeobacter sp.]|nr:AsmA-like C-terminal region-containing protein [Candidatus Udaeobacter sp.]